MSRIPYTFARDSIAAVINPLAESRLVQAGIPIVGYPGVRGGGGFLIMPSVEQLFYDNYFSHQTVDQALGAPWARTGDGTTIARNENVLIGDYSIEIDITGGTTSIYQAYQTAAVMTMSAFIYMPPPASIEDIFLYQGDGWTIDSSINFVSLGGYWYFVWTTATGQNDAGDRWGVYYSPGNPGRSIWVSCLSLTQTAAPVGFIPNANAGATITSEDDNLKFVLAEPLPQSGSISFVYIPFYENDGSGGTYPRILSFMSSGGNSGGNDRMELYVDDAHPGGFRVRINTGGAGVLATPEVSSLTAFKPLDMVVTWDVIAGGTKTLQIILDGKSIVEDSAVLANGFPTNLVDMWVGCERSGASAWQQHAQGIIQDVQIHRR